MVQSNIFDICTRMGIITIVGHSLQTIISYTRVMRSQNKLQCSQAVLRREQYGLGIPSMFSNHIQLVDISILLSFVPHTRTSCGSVVNES